MILQHRKHLEQYQKGRFLSCLGTLGQAYPSGVALKIEVVRLNTSGQVFVHTLSRNRPDVIQYQDEKVVRLKPDQPDWRLHHCILNYMQCSSFLLHDKLSSYTAT